MKRLNFRAISDRKTLVLAALSLIFFFVYSFLPLSGPEKFVSPDETANFVFTKIYAQNDLPRLYEPLNHQVDNLIYPRSVNVSGDYLVPGSFLGLILIYGILAKLFGLLIIPFLSPAFAVLAVLAFYKLIKKIFDLQTAFVSSLIFLIQPAWWYWTSRSMANNVLFFSLAIISLATLLGSRRKNKLTFVFAGFFFGLAIITRTSEIVWLGFLLLILAIIARRKISVIKISFFIVSLILIILPLFYFNSQLYQSPFASGYSRIGNDLPPPRFLISRAQIQGFFFPFEVLPANFAANFYSYVVLFFWPYFILFLAGLIFFFINIKKTDWPQRFYFIIFTMVSFYLVVYYGSWNFHDNLDPEKITIGTSYVRYWLPIYIFSLPFVALIFSKILTIFKKRYLRFGLSFLLGASLFIYSANLVFSGEEGLLQVRQNLAEYKEKAIIINKITEKDAVIVADRNDKIVFPDRLVVSCLIADCPKFESLSKLIKLAPVYYYPSSSNFKADQFNGEILVKYGLEINEEQVVKDTDRIYKFKIKNEE